MSLDFIKERKNARYLSVASRQQKQIAYFTQSKTQDEISVDYINKWAEKSYYGNDYFLNWVKSIFKKQNALSFYKYCRYPLVSAQLINDEIVPQLERVYFADDSYFKYTVKGKQIEKPIDLDLENFESKLFNALLFNYNDIIVHDLKEVNKAFREIVCIDNVISIESENNVIEKIAYTAELYNDDGSETYGYLYIDDKGYKFYDREAKTDVPLIDIPHDLGRCPATWISNKPYNNETDIVRKSIFSYVRNTLEEFVFLSTLLKMTEPNGALASLVQIKLPKQNPNQKQQLGKEPDIANGLGGQKSSIVDETNGDDNPSIMQAGSVVNIPLDKLKDKDGNYDTTLIQSFAKHYYIPPENLEYMKTRISELKTSIISTVLGDYSEQNQSAKNELQVSKSYVNKQDKLRAISTNLSWCRTISDTFILSLNYGKENVSVSCFYGSDFFLETEGDLYELFKNTPNQIERRNILSRISKTKYRHNKEKSERDNLLYQLLPFASDADFDKAVSNKLISDEIKSLQLQFTYWISFFEAEYGDILIFFNTFAESVPNSQRLIAINKLLINIVKTQQNGNN